VRTPLGAAVALAFIAGLVSPVSAVASPTIPVQTTAAQSISGHVTDSSGRPLAGATITIAGSGKTFTLTSASDGGFSQALEPGVYSVTINHGGFQSAQSDVAVTAGGRSDFTVPLQEANLSGLRVIGRTSVTTNRTPFNVSESSVATLPQQEIGLRLNNNLTDIVGDMPGVTITRTFSSTPNTNFQVRGGSLQTKVTIDGHPVSSGISGTWNTNYAISTLFNNVEVDKGTGLNGAIAGESAVGTVNLRTRDFSRNNSYGFSFGPDSYGSGVYTAYADMNFLKNDKLSVIVAKAFTAYNGPWQSEFLDRTGNTSSPAAFVGLGQPPQLIGLDQWQGDFSNRYSLQGELVKARYRLSESSSITAEYLGLQGQYQPQGGAYGTYNGLVTLQACQLNNAKPGAGFASGGAFVANLAGCNASSLYEPPYVFNNVGNQIPSYSWFPNSYIQNNEPQFAAEFRTSYKDDTLLFRPYTHVINRYISGVNENQYPGNGTTNTGVGGWFAVTSAANCQVKFLAPNVTGGPASGAAGPCFPLTTGPNGPAYIGSDATGHGFATTSSAPSCSPTPPYTCFTTPTGIENDGNFGYGTPFSQPEFDQLSGYTFTYLHPVKDNTYTFSYDYRRDFTQSASTDQTAAAAGCQFVIGSVKSGAVYDKNGALFQPGCTTSLFGKTGPYAQYNLLPRSSVGVPPTVSQYGDFALTGTFRISDKLRAAIGNYYEIYRADAQIEDPAVLNAYATLGNSSAAPVSLITKKLSYSHYDPHVGLEYRMSRDTSVRANAGSSITEPYPSLISGFGSVSIPNAAAVNYTLNIPNVGLQPETTVAYDLGFDQRLQDGGVLSLDLYDFTVHNVFLSNTQQIPVPAGVPTFPGTLGIQSQTINGPINRNYGVELSLTKIPTLGFGYYVSGTLTRSFNDQLPLSIYAFNTSASNTNFLINGLQFGIPYFKSYGQLLYVGENGTTLELGADYEGNNNSTFGPPYTLWDAAARVPVGHGFALQASVQNLLGYSNGTQLGRVLSQQGAIQPAVWLNNGVLTYAGVSSPLQALSPRTFRLILSFDTGNR
jgi:outer membrane receptor protein involved in Fe transport